MIIQIDEENYIEYKEAEGVAEVNKKEEILKQLEEVNSQLSQIPEAPSDSMLLEWARTNYPVVNSEAEIEQLKIKKLELENKLEHYG